MEFRLIVKQLSISVHLLPFEMSSSILSVFSQFICIDIHPLAAWVCLDAQVELIEAAPSSSCAEEILPSWPNSHKAAAFPCPLVQLVAHISTERKQSLYWHLQDHTQYSHVHEQQRCTTLYSFYPADQVWSLLARHKHAQHRFQQEQASDVQSMQQMVPKPQSLPSTCVWILKIPRFLGYADN